MTLMAKRGVLLASLLLVLSSTLVLAQTNENPFQPVLDLLYNLDPTVIYAKAAPLIDFILLFAMFYAIASAAFGERFGPRTGMLAGTVSVALAGSATAFLHRVLQYTLPAGASGIPQKGLFILLGKFSIFIILLLIFVGVYLAFKMGGWTDKTLWLLAAMGTAWLILKSLFSNTTANAGEVGFWFFSVNTVKLIDSLALTAIMVAIVVPLFTGAFSAGKKVYNWHQNRKVNSLSSSGGPISNSNWGRGAQVSRQVDDIETHQKMDKNLGEEEKQFAKIELKLEDDLSKDIQKQIDALDTVVKKTGELQSIPREKIQPSSLQVFTDEIKKIQKAGVEIREFEQKFDQIGTKLAEDIDKYMKDVNAEAVELDRLQRSDVNTKIMSGEESKKLMAYEMQMRQELDAMHKIIETQHGLTKHTRENIEKIRTIDEQKNQFPLLIEQGIAFIRSGEFGKASFAFNEAKKMKSSQLSMLEALKGETKEVEKLASLLTDMQKKFSKDLSIIKDIIAKLKKKESEERAKEARKPLEKEFSNLKV